MSTAFPRMVTLLRKERGLSQKQAASDLGISQALLSHYEKGIRECGLEFVVRCAEYYGVSCDYLLGRTADRTGAVILADELPENDPSRPDKVMRGSVAAVLQKKLLSNSTQVLYEVLQQYNCKALTNEVSAYLSMSLYAMFRALYSADPKNPEAMFSAPEYLYRAQLLGEMSRAAANVEQLASGKNAGELSGVDPSRAPELSAAAIAEQYPLFATSLASLLHNVEERLQEKNA